MMTEEITSQNNAMTADIPSDLVMLGANGDYELLDRDQEFYQGGSNELEQLTAFEGQRPSPEPSADVAVSGLLLLKNKKHSKKNNKSGTGLLKRKYAATFDDGIFDKVLSLEGTYLIKDDDLNQYVIRCLMPKIEELFPATSLFGFNGFTIKRERFDEFFLSDYTRRKGARGMEEGLEMLMKAQTKPRDEYARFRSSDQFLEMMKACGFRMSELPGELDAAHNMEFRYSPVDAFIEAYRFTVKNELYKGKAEVSLFFENQRANRLKLISKCPPLLYKILKFYDATRLESSKVAKCIEDPQPLSEEEVRTRVIFSAHYYFFPFSNLEYDQKKIPKLFTVYMQDTLVDGAQGVDDSLPAPAVLQFNAKQEYLQMSSAFVKTVPKYYQWIKINGRVF
jgi:hypothetical protein